MEKMIKMFNKIIGSKRSFTEHVNDFWETRQYVLSNKSYHTVDIGQEYTDFFSTEELLGNLCKFNDIFFYDSCFINIYVEGTNKFSKERLFERVILKRIDITGGFIFIDNYVIPSIENVFNIAKDFICSKGADSLDIQIILHFFRPTRKNINNDYVFIIHEKYERSAIF
jgi:hypothetical protein